MAKLELDGGETWIVLLGLPVALFTALVLAFILMAAARSWGEAATDGTRVKLEPQDTEMRVRVGFDVMDAELGVRLQPKAEAVEIPTTFVTRTPEPTVIPPVIKTTVTKASPVKVFEPAVPAKKEVKNLEEKEDEEDELLPPPRGVKVPR